MLRGDRQIPVLGAEGRDLPTPALRAAQVSLPSKRRKFLSSDEGGKDDILIEPVSWEGELTVTHLDLHVGVKSDPIEYRFSYEWLFRLLADEGIHHVQLGSFFEMYHFSDEFFLDLRRLADKYAVTISSVFTTHRELGGFFRDEHPAWETAARRSLKRMVEVGALVGAQCVGGNPGAVMRDRLDFKPEGMRRYLGYMRELMGYARDKGLACLTIEPMSCLAEPPTLPDEIRSLAEELLAYHREHPHETVPVGYCVDVAHGYVNQDDQLVCDNLQLIQAALPYVRQMHLKNTDARFEAVFGFSPAERQQGIVHIEEIRDLLLRNAHMLPVNSLVGYLEIGGPKTGRDYSDFKLEAQLRTSLRYLRDTFVSSSQPE
jgi:sugar phosphate isomerase/epimerase